MNVNRSDMADLVYFCAIARHRSFSKAAVELGVSASTLSHALKGFEARLGVRLLNRTTKSVTLTAAGESLASAVSEPVARAMAEGARRVLGCDLAVASTGVAGPDPDERGNPVGLVYLALAAPDGTWVRKIQQGLGRERVRHVSASHAFDLARRYLSGLEVK